MTKEEAIAELRDVYSNALEWKDSRTETAFSMAFEALENADKYKWHDLLKDPADLPSEYATVEVVLSTVEVYDIAIYCKDYGFRPWYEAYFQECPEEWDYKVMAWRDVERFEEDEE